MNNDRKDLSWMEIFPDFWQESAEVVAIVELDYETNLDSRFPEGLVHFPRLGSSNQGQGTNLTWNRRLGINHEHIRFTNLNYS